VTLHPEQPLVVGNWKMNLGEATARTLVTSLVGSLPFDRVNAVVAPAFPCLRAVLDAAGTSPLAVGAQNVHWLDKGAFTGEVAPAMLAEMGVHFVIVGHSERRAQFGETDDTVALKVAAAARHGLTPILCVGESEAQRDLGLTHDVVVGQVRAALAGAAAILPRALVVAYEPVWAIGTGKTPQADEVTSAHAAIRGALGERFAGEATAIRILYGGSVTAENAARLLRAPEVNGALVGGASLSAESFVAIAAAAGSC